MNKHLSKDERVFSFPICDGVELSVTSSEDSRKVNLHLGNQDVGLYLEPNKKQLQRLIRNLKQIENSLKG